MDLRFLMKKIWKKQKNIYLNNITKTEKNMFYKTTSRKSEHSEKITSGKIIVHPQFKPHGTRSSKKQTEKENGRRMEKRKRTDDIVIHPQLKRRKIEASKPGNKDSDFIKLKMLTFTVHKDMLKDILPKIKKK